MSGPSCAAGCAGPRRTTSRYAPDDAPAAPCGWGVPVVDTGAMWRGVLVGLVLAGLTGTATPTPPTGPPTGPSTGPMASGPASPVVSTPAATVVCTVADPRVRGLGGLVATADGYVAVNDANADPKKIEIFYLDRRCQLIRAVGYPTPARDPEDLALAADGSLWIADTGDNITNKPDQRRATVALWRLAPNSATPVIYRLAYPDGPHDAEALLLADDGTPVIMTKELLAPAGLYVPAAALSANNTQPVALRKVGSFSPYLTGTSNPFGVVGQLIVTGAGRSPDGHRLAIRTYSDAYEFTVTGGDIISAITTGTPQITALPDEPQGEAVAYSTDGKQLLTLSDQRTGSTQIRAYPAAPPPRPTTPPAPTRRTGSASTSSPRFTSPALVGAAAATAGVGLVLAVLGVMSIRRSRRRTSDLPDDPTATAD
jgi:hypothetical protein